MSVGNDVLLGEETITSPIALGATSNLTKNITIEATVLSGLYFILINVDAENSIDESNEGNNIRASSAYYQIADQPVPILSGSSITFSEGGDKYRNRSYTVSYEIANQGTGPSSANLPVSFYLSADTSISTNDVYIGLDTVVNPIAAGGTTGPRTKGFTIPGTTPLGSYYMGMILETGGTGRSTTVYQIKEAQPDLVGSSLAFSTLGTKYKGTNYLITYTIMNQGIDTTRSAFKVKYYLSTDTTITTADTYLKEKTIPNTIVGGSSITVIDTVTISVSQVTGNYYIGMVLDTENSIAESNETNNTKVSSTAYSISEMNTSPAASFTVTPSSGTTSTTFSFDASGSSDAQDAVALLQIRWDWENDGAWDTSYDTTKVITHQYTTAGTYTIKLEVKDTGGLSATTTKQCTVRAGSGTGGHFIIAYSNTGNNSTIMIPTTVTITMDGVSISPAVDDEIAIYTPLPDTICYGVGKWTGSNLSITVWGDNDQTATIKEGFTSGQLYRFHLWDASASKEYRNFSSAVFSSGKATYSINGISTVKRLNFYLAADSLSINLSSGWNMISSNVKANDSSMLSIFYDIESKIVIVKNNNGQVYWPEYGINQIGSWRIIDGYMVYMKKGETLRIFGARINPASTSMTLPSGWSMIAYLPNVSIAPSTALTSLGSTIVIVKDGSGKVYWPQYGVNQIGTMQVGKGYQIYLSSSGTLTYPASASKEGREIAESGYQKGSLLPQHFRFTRGTGVNATLLIKSKNTENQMGEIGVFTPGGICAGAGVMDGENVAITVWGDDKQTSTIDGFTEGAEYRFRVWDKSTNTERETSMMAESGDLFYKENGITVLSLDNAVPQEFALKQNYPNPFNPNTTIEYQLKSPGEITLAIYNTVGQLVRTLKKGSQSAGVYSVQWDGRNDSGIQMSSGIYLYKLRTGNFVQTRKMMLLK